MNGGLKTELDRISSELECDTVHVASPSHGGRSPFDGVLLDASFRGRFRTVYTNQVSGQPSIYAAGRIMIAPSRTGYLLRVPSQYSSSAVDLWVWSDSEHVWLAPVRVADAFGDEGWLFALDGWLVDINGDGQRDLVQRRVDRWVVDYVSGGEASSDSLTARFWTGTGFGERTLLSDSLFAAAFKILPEPPRCP